MQTTSRNHGFGGGYAGKRGHIPQLSISDENHHVTEAIGDMYGDHNYGKSDSRPLSFITSSAPSTSQNSTTATSAESPLSLRSPPPIIRTTSNERLPSQANGLGLTMPPRTTSFERENGASSSGPSFRERTNADTAKTHFPLTDLGYESDPAAVAQELSNLQALRRMSMDVNGTGDPDLPPFNSKFIPSAAPTGSSDEDDRARLFWVPARIHPELAPTEFKTFIDSRVNSIKRRTEERSLSPDGSQSEGSGGGLRRKKSMLSRQIDNSGGKGADGYTDGAELLDRKRSLSGGEKRNAGISNLQELEALVSDPALGRQKLIIDTGSSSGSDKVAGDDMPILPIGPGGNSLRRSTRTTYRRGSLRRGERVFPKRGTKPGETDGDESPISNPGGDFHGLIRVQTEPLPPTEKVAENFSRPARSRRDMQTKHPATDVSHDISSPPSEPTSREMPSTTPAPRHFVSQIASNGRKLESPFHSAKAVPHNAESHPPSDETRQTPKACYLPERISSHEPPPPYTPQGPPAAGSSSTRGTGRPIQARQNLNEKGNQTLKDMAAYPSPLPGNSTRTDSLSFIPTLTEDKKVESKKVKEKKDKDGGDAPRKSSWSWGALLGSEEKERERKRDDEPKKARSKMGKVAEKSHDNTRLDLLQTTMEGSRGRESLVLDRGEFKLDEERKKESSRKSSGSEGKREKDASLFSTLFGGKKKAERESTGKKQILRSFSPDPPQRILKPDVDYSWTRFSILEERAIYRMAHIKLANPRRALHSQVLLSNFMYSYLAKVQQMHPQIQIPQAAVQKPRKAEQPDEFYQYQKYQEHQQKQQEHEDDQGQGELQDSGNQLDDGQYEHGPPEYDQGLRPQSRASQHDSHTLDNGIRQHHHGGDIHQARTQQQQVPSFQYQQSQFDEPGRSADEMW